MLLQLFGFLLTTSLFANNLDSIASVADQYFRDRNYSFASVEYERMIFLSKNDTLVNKLLLQKSYCCKLNYEYSDAVSTLSRIDLSIEPQSFKDTIYYERALNFYLNNDFVNAELNLLNINQEIINYTTYLYLLTLNENDNWEKASEIFEKLIVYKNLNPADYNYYSFRKSLKNDNKNLVTIMSLIVPGTGQLYLKKPKDAVFSFLLTSLSGAFTVDSFLNGYIFSGVLMAMPIFIRFYFGGIQNINRIIEHRTLEFKNKMNKELREKILEFNELLY